MNFFVYLTKVYSVLALPFWRALYWLTEHTGKPATFYARIPVWALVPAGATEAAHGLTQGSIWGTMDAVVVTLLTALVIPWALKRIDKMQRAIESGSESYPLSQSDLFIIIWWTVLYGYLGLFMLGALLTDGDPAFLRDFCIVWGGSWIICDFPGGKRQKATAWKPAWAGA